MIPGTWTWVLVRWSLLLSLGGVIGGILGSRYFPICPSAGSAGKIEEYTIERLPDGTERKTKKITKDARNLLPGNLPESKKDFGLDLSIELQHGKEFTLGVERRLFDMGSVSVFGRGSVDYDTETEKPKAKLGLGVKF